MYFFLFHINIQLVPANKVYPTIRIDKKEDFRIWGVVIYNIKRLHWVNLQPGFYHIWSKSESNCFFTNFPVIDVFDSHTRNLDISYVY